jgi:hypothetical protein
MRKSLLCLAFFAAGYLVCHYAHPGRRPGNPADPREVNPVEVRNNRGLHAKLTAHRVTLANPSAVISDSFDLTSAPDDARPLWRITFADGKVAYLLTEDSPK